MAALAVAAAVVIHGHLEDKKIYQLPDPVTFFGQEAKNIDREEDSERYTFLFDGDPAPMVEAYEDLLDSEEYDLFMMKDTGSDTGHEYLMSSSKFVFMGHRSKAWDNMDAVLLDDWLLDSGAHVVEVTLYNLHHLEFTPQDRYKGPPIGVSGGSAPADPAPVQDPAPVETPAETPEAPVETAPAETPAPDLSGPTLPDIDSFSGGALQPLRGGVFLDHTKKNYSIHYNAKFIQEYVDLLGNYGFTLKRTVDSGHGDNYYLFDYTGPGTAGTFYPDVKKIKDEPVAVYIWDCRGLEIQIYYADGITYTDTGDRTTQTLTPYEGSAAAESSSTDWGESSSSWKSDTKIKCTKCHGDKEVECPQCNGSGKLANLGSTPNYSGSSRSTYSDYKDCTKCHGHKTVTCPRCNGTGWE